MTLEQFKETNDKYRVICEFDDNLCCVDKDSVMIPVYDNKGFIYWLEENKLGMVMFSSPNIIIEKIKKEYDIEIYSFGELQEYYLEFDSKYLDIIAKFFKAKKQIKAKIPPNSIRNITTFLRIMSNIHPRYKEKLEKYIADNRAVE